MIQFGDKFGSQQVLELLQPSLPYYLRSWENTGPDTGLFGTTNPKTFNMRKIGSSSPVIEYVVRPHIQTLCILASLLCKDYFPRDGPLSRDETVDKLTRGLHWVCATHLTGDTDVEEFLQRKRWGENWRSGLWAALMGVCSFLGKKYLDEETRRQVERVVAFEASRFVGVMPPSGCDFDTKLEENAQDSMVLAWAINLMPDHEQARQWTLALNLWGLNIASSVHDRADHSEHLGKSVSLWTTTRTLFPDMTAENHGFFHPEILAYSAWVVLATSAFRLHNRKVPDCLQRKNHQDTFDILLRFCLPCGLVFAPSCTDLPLFFPRPFMLAWGLWNNDPRARRMTTCLLSWMDSHLTPGDSSDTPWVTGFTPRHEGWELLFQSQVGFELAMLAVLPFPEEHRFYSLGQIENAVDTRRTYPHVEVCYRRNTRTSRSVAWKALGKHPIIGLNIHSYPELLVPYNANMLGVPRTNPGVKYSTPAFHSDRLHRDGFDTTGRIDYFAGSGSPLLRRDLRILTWGDDGLVIFDQITAEQDLIFEEQHLSPVHVVNDKWTGGEINLVSGSLREVIRADSENDRPLSCPSFWASVEMCLLVQFIWTQTKGLTYLPGNGRNAPRYWTNCRLDTLAVHVNARECPRGEMCYQVGLYVGAGKGPRPFKCAGTCGEFFRGLVVMDGKTTVGLD